MRTAAATAPDRNRTNIVLAVLALGHERLPGGRGRTLALLVDSPENRSVTGGFQLRAATTADIPRIAAVHVASWNAHYRGILDDAEIDRRTLDVRIYQWTQTFAHPNQATYVAEGNAGAMLGFTSALVLPDAPDGFDAYLGLLYLVAQAKGKGVGRALLRAIAAELIRRKCKNVALRVLRENPARAFYEHLGARLVPEGIANDAGLFDDVVYAFDDLTTLR